MSISYGFLYFYPSPSLFHTEALLQPSGQVRIENCSPFNHLLLTTLSRSYVSLDCIISAMCLQPHEGVEEGDVLQAKVSALCR